MERGPVHAFSMATLDQNMFCAQNQLPTIGDRQNRQGGFMGAMPNSQQQAQIIALQQQQQGYQQLQQQQMQQQQLQQHQLQQQQLQQQQLQQQCMQQQQQYAVDPMAGAAVCPTTMGQVAVGRAAAGPDGPWRAPPGSADDPTMEAYLSRTLYMKSLSSAMTEEKLKEMCEAEGGNVRKVTVQSNKRLGFVEFYDIRAAEKARAALKGLSVLDGDKPMEVQYSCSREDRSVAKDGTPAPRSTLYMRPSTPDKYFVDPNSTESYRELFSRYGEIKKINVNKKRDAEKFIEFYDVRAAENALNALNGQTIGGVKLEIQYANCSSKTLNKDSPIHDLLLAQTAKMKAAYSQAGIGEVCPSVGYNPVRGNQGGRKAASTNATPWGVGNPYEMSHMAPTAAGGWPDAQAYQQYAAALQRQMMGFGIQPQMLAASGGFMPGPMPNRGGGRGRGRKDGSFLGGANAIPLGGKDADSPRFTAAECIVANATSLAEAAKTRNAE
eukprot:Selendium_serpulae@DN6103_c0_g1_i1.p1